MLLATPRELDTANFTHSGSQSVFPAYRAKGRNRGRDKGREHSRTSASSHSLHPIPVSNRELSLLERALSYCKQSKATLSNRELWTNQCCCKFCVLIPLRFSLNLSRIRTFVRGTATGNRETARGTVSLCPTITFAAVFAAPNCASPEKSSALSNLNRQTHEFRNAVTYRKQTAAHCANSQKFQKWMCAFSPFFPPTRVSPRTNAPTENEL